MNEAGAEEPKTKNPKQKIMKLICDSGATKAEWCLLNNGKKKFIQTEGISPYFLSAAEIKELVTGEVGSKVKQEVSEVYFYGTGLFDADNVKMMKKVLQQCFPGAKVSADHDMLGAAHALCGNEKGIVCNLGTGTFSCYYNGKKITTSRPGDGYVLGDEGSGAYLGKKVIQHYLYKIFDEELMYRFDEVYSTNRSEIIDKVYRKPFPNRYLASYALFLAENRGHYMVENILEDGINDFFFYHLNKFPEAWKSPIYFTGSVAFGFKDVLKNLCESYGFELGKVLQKPMPGLIAYHR